MDGVIAFSMPYVDQPRAKKFYSSAFGWEIAKIPNLDNVWVATTESDPKTMLPTKVGAVNGGMMPKTSSGVVTIIIVGVKSITDSIKKVTAAGGKVTLSKTVVGDLGFYAQVVDTEGNQIGLWEFA